MSRFSPRVKLTNTATSAAISKWFGNQFVTFDSFTPQGSAYEIAQYTVLTTSVSQVVFTVPSGYRHLQIFSSARTNFAQTDSNMNLWFNNDSDLNYSGHYLFSNGTGLAAGGGGDQSQLIICRGTGANSASGIYGHGVTTILDYSSTTKGKTVRSLTGHDQNMAVTGYIFQFTGGWRSLDPVTSIQITTSNGYFATNSTFTLVGYK